MVFALAILGKLSLFDIGSGLITCDLCSLNLTFIIVLRCFEMCLGPNGIRTNKFGGLTYQYKNSG